MPYVVMSANNIVIVAQVLLTVLILVSTMFILGFIADPIIDFAFDPYGAIVALFGSRRTYHYDIVMEEDSGWLEHFTKGFASLGLLSFLKVLFASPIQFFFRSSQLGGHRTGTGTTGRDRLSSTTWLLIIIGVGTFLFVSTTDCVAEPCANTCCLGCVERS
jgi:hypothetical protein